MVYSKKKRICNACKTLGFSKPLSKKQIENELKKTTNSDVQINISNTNTNNTNTNITNNENIQNNTNKKKVKIKNQRIISEMMRHTHPEPAKSRKKGLHFTNPLYRAERKRKVWKNCCNGMIEYIIAVLHHIWSKTDDGLFSEHYYKDSIVFKSMKILDFEDWENIKPNTRDIKTLLNKKPKSIPIEVIKKKLIIRQQIKLLLKHVKDNDMKSLEMLFDMSINTFMNKLSLFIFDYLEEYCKDDTRHHTEVVHRVLFNGKDDGTYNEIKCYIDCIWHIQGSENMAETGLKTIGNILSPGHMRLLFDKLMKKGMIQMLLPCHAEENELKKDCLLQAKVDGKKSMKTDSRSYDGSIKFRNMVEKDTGRMPYGNKD